MRPCCRGGVLNTRTLVPDPYNRGASVLTPDKPAGRRLYFMVAGVGLFEIYPGPWRVGDLASLEVHVLKLGQHRVHGLAAFFRPRGCLVASETADGPDHHIV